MKQKIFTAASLLLLSAAFIVPSDAAAQSSSGGGGASGAVSGAASCALGGAIAQAITSALSGALSGGASSAVAGGTADGVTALVAVPVLAPATDAHLVVANTQLGLANGQIGAQNTKSFTLDRLASCAAKALLHQMTADTINWINSGFKGGPAFLSNPQAFLLDTADQLTGEMISDSGPLKSLCSPWNVDIRLALALEQSNGGSFNSKRYACTLSKIINNAQNAKINVSLDGFMAGDFSQGGWDAFLTMTAGSQNPAMQYLIAKSELQAAINKGIGAINKDLDRGFGFLSDTQCETVNLQSSSYNTGTTAPGETSRIIPNSDGTTGKYCVTKTPGSVISHALNVHTDSGVVETELANDINAVVSALVTQLTSQMLTKGLATLSGSHSGVSVSGSNNIKAYTTQLQQEAAAPQTVTSGGTTYTLKNGTLGLQTSTTTPSSLDAIFAPAITAVTTSRDAYASANECYVKLIQVAGNTSAQNARFQRELSSINITLSTQIQPLLTSLTAQKLAGSAKQTVTSDDTTAATQAASSATTQATTWNTEAAAALSACQAGQ